MDLQWENMPMETEVMRGGDSKVCEDAPRKCECSNAFNAIVKTNRTSNRAREGIITNPLERVRNVYLLD
jgi:hypothetical protein